MIYAVKVGRAGRTETIIVEDVMSEDEAKKKALIEAEDGFIVQETKRIS